MTDLSVQFPHVDNTFQKVRHLLLKEAKRLEEKHEEQEQITRVAVMMYYAQRKQQGAELARRWLALSHLAALVSTD